MACAKSTMRALLFAVSAALLLAGCAEEPKRPPAKPVAQRPAATKSAKAKTSSKKAGASRKPAGAPSRPATSAPATPPAKPLTPDERYAQALQQMKSNDLQGAETALLTSVKDFPAKTGP